MLFTFVNKIWYKVWDFYGLAFERDARKAEQSKQGSHMHESKS